MSPGVTAPVLSPRPQVSAQPVLQVRLAPRQLTGPSTYGKEGCGAGGGLKAPGLSARPSLGPGPPHAQGSALTSGGPRCPVVPWIPLPSPGAVPGQGLSHWPEVVLGLLSGEEGSSGLFPQWDGVEEQGLGRLKGLSRLVGKVGPPPPPGRATAGNRLGSSTPRRWAPPIKASRSPPATVPAGRQTLGQRNVPRPRAADANKGRDGGGWLGAEHTGRWRPGAGDSWEHSEPSTRAPGTSEALCMRSLERSEQRRAHS